jgi:hypothetical protein
VGEAAAFLKSKPDSSLETVEFCIFDSEAYAFFKAEIEKF